MKERLLILTIVGTSAIDSKKLDRLFLRDLWINVKYELDKLPPGDTSHHAWASKEVNPPRAIQAFVEKSARMVCEEIAIDNEAIEEEMKRTGYGATSALSAEFTSLYLLNPQSDTDHISLLLSDTPEGIISGLINELVIKTKFGIQPDIDVIFDLQSANLANFKNKGLAVFQALIEAQIQEHGGYLPLLNVTGGYKSIVPYATYLAFAYGIELYFVFEEQPQRVIVKLEDHEDRPNIGDSIKRLLDERGLKNSLSIDDKPRIQRPFPPF